MRHTHPKTGTGTRTKAPKEDKQTGEGGTATLGRVEKLAIQAAARSPGLSNAAIARSLGLGSRSHVARRLGAGGDLRAHVRALLEAAGFDDQTIIRAWAKQVRALETKHFSYQGIVKDSRRVVNLDARTDALREVTKLARLYPEAAEEERARQGGPTSVEIVFQTAPPSHDSSADVEITANAPSIYRGAPSAANRDRQGRP